VDPDQTISEEVTTMDAPTPVEERMLWTGSPSQWLNFPRFLLSGILIIAMLAGIAAASVTGAATLGNLALPLSIALWVLMVLVLLYAIKKYLDIRYRIYTITDQRIRVTRGILSKRTDGLELYRVDDTLLLEPFILRLVARGNVRLVTSDHTNPEILIQAVPHARQLWEQLRMSVEACRDRKRTRVVDFEPQNN
jgi:uncharacterized membrane protein YdbT with pleckstrin-like domain